MNTPDRLTLIHGSAHKTGLPSASVDCIVTSPPYYWLREYDGNQHVEWDEVSYSPIPGIPPITIPAINCPLGLEPTINAYIGHLVTVMREMHRVLAATGTLWLNIGDGYSTRSSPATSDSTRKSTLQGGKSTQKQSRRATAHKPRDLPQKNLCLIPQRIALALQADGWLIRNEIVWHKPNPYPENVKDRMTRSNEKIIFASKSPRYYFDNNAIREMIRPGNDKGANKRDVWTLTADSTDYDHFAPMPREIATLCIRAGCPTDGLVLDPFNGTGTTGQIAIEQNKRYIGIDICKAYLEDITPARLNGTQVNLL